jgi:DNA-binding MltR family transcriptional regulator
MNENDEPKHIKAFLCALSALNDELGETKSDRVAVIMSVALLDNALESVLRQFFIARSGATPDECDFLLTKQPVPPLGSAGVRVRLAKCLGIISVKEARALKFAISCRNDFAHQLAPPPLTEDVAKGLADRLPNVIRDMAATARNVMAPHNGDSATPRWIFITACVAVYVFLSLRAAAFAGEAF